MVSSEWKSPQAIRRITWYDDIEARKWGNQAISKKEFAQILSRIRYNQVIR